MEEENTLRSNVPMSALRRTAFDDDDDDDDDGCDGTRWSNRHQSHFDDDATRHTTTRMIFW
jgi:hypothetical protein